MLYSETFSETLWPKLCVACHILLQTHIPHRCDWRTVIHNALLTFDLGYVRLSVRFVFVQWRNKLMTYTLHTVLAVFVQLHPAHTLLWNIVWLLFEVLHCLVGTPLGGHSSYANLFFDTLFSWINYSCGVHFGEGNNFTEINWSIDTLFGTRHLYYV